MGIPGRIRNERAYRDSQPDLDIYNPCFEGYASNRFRGSDIDGLFVSICLVHGIWERLGYLCFLEHKSSPTSWVEPKPALGQWIALNALAEVHPQRQRVLITYGEDPNDPQGYQWLPLPGWRTRICADGHVVHKMDIREPAESPLRRWIKWVSEKARPSQPDSWDPDFPLVRDR